MKFSGIDMQGYFKSEIVVDASALVWQGPDIDERRIVYDETEKALWIADDVEWKKVGRYNNFPKDTEMWFYQDAAPDPGWTISGTASDVLTAVKGGSTYDLGGAIRGSWATPAHSHPLGGHTHTASGTVNPAYGSKESDTGSGAAETGHVHSISLGSGGPSTATNISGASLTFRPRARVGIICIREET